MDALNSEKTEVVLFTSKHNAMQIENDVRVGDTDITSVNSVKNLGVIFDSAMNMEQHLNSVCRSGYYPDNDLRANNEQSTRGSPS